MFTLTDECKSGLELLVAKSWDYCIEVRGMDFEHPSSTSYVITKQLLWQWFVPLPIMCLVDMHLNLGELRAEMITLTSLEWPFWWCINICSAWIIGYNTNIVLLACIMHFCFSTNQLLFFALGFLFVALAATCSLFLNRPISEGIWRYLQFKPYAHSDLNLHLGTCSARWLDFLLRNSGH